MKERPWPSLSKLSRDRLQGMHPDPVRMVERAIQDSVADYVAACRATGQKPFLDGPQFELSRACRQID